MGLLTGMGVTPSSLNMADGNYSQYNMDGSHVNEETVTHLRQRLNVMREIVKDEDKDGKKKKRKRGKCIDTIIDGSMMGAVLAVCLQEPLLRRHEEMVPGHLQELEQRHQNIQDMLVTFVMISNQKLHLPSKYCAKNIQYHYDQ